MISFESVSMRYPDASTPVLQDVTFEIAEGELCLVVGQTGSGKTTLLRAINGLVPHFTGGTLGGRVLVDGRDTRTHRPRDLADVVGVVGQDPLAGFVTDTVEDELAYGMESLALPHDVMRPRVEETLDLLGLAGVRTRSIATLSGGQQQRVAIGAVLTTHPQVLVLDEPTSALDPQAAEDVLSALQRLVHDLGITVVLAEHRLERVVQYANKVVHVPGGGRPVEVGLPADVMATSPVAPPVVELGRLAGWQPLPLSVRDARSLAGPLRERLAAAVPPQAPSPSGGPPPASPDPARPVASVRGLVVRYGGRRAGRTPALHDVDLDFVPGEVLAVMGRNGAGKSSLLNALVGLVKPEQGSVQVAGIDPTTAKPRAGGEGGRSRTAGSGSAAVHRVGHRRVPAGRSRLRCRTGTLRRHPGQSRTRGSRRAASAGPVRGAAPVPRAVGRPHRPTAAGPARRTHQGPGLSRQRRASSASCATSYTAAATAVRSVVFATHDVELVAEVANRVVVLADGEVVADGPVGSVIAASPTFAPQVAKILRPQPWLTVSQVAGVLEPAS